MQRRHFVLSFSSCVVIVLTGLYSLEALSMHIRVLQNVLSVFAGAFLANLIFFYWTKKLELCCRIAGALIFIMILCLVFYGRYKSAVLYWAFPFPIALFGLLGARLGLIACASLIACLASMFYWPFYWSKPIMVYYSASSKAHALAALSIVIMLGWLNEYSRERSHLSMERLQRRKEAQANTDALTQLFNRRFVDQILPGRLRRHSADFFPLAIISCDLDHFKRINDNYGHDVGDQALKHVARLLKRHLRGEDMACRSGGEEFLLLLPHCEEEPARRVAEALRGILENHPFTLRESGEQLAITASFGVSQCRDVEGLSDALKQADKALYVAKRAGRNRVEPAMLNEDAIDISSR